MSWVTDRAKCNVKGVFEEFIKFVERDINEMNHKFRGRQQFIFDETGKYSDPPVIRVKREIGPQHLIYTPPNGAAEKLTALVCTIVYYERTSPEYIFIGEWHEASLREGLGSIIRPAWDQEDGSCRVSIQDSDGRERYAGLDDLLKVFREFLEPFFPE